MTQLYTNLEGPATNVAYDQEALNSSTSHQSSPQAWKVDGKGTRRRELGHMEKLRQRGLRWPMFWGLVALLNLFPCTLPPHGATMAIHGHSQDGMSKYTALICATTKFTS